MVGPFPEVGVWLGPAFVIFDLDPTGVFAAFPSFRPPCILLRKFLTTGGDLGSGYRVIHGFSASKYDIMFDGLCARPRS